jgi:hypothetical protein
MATVSKKQRAEWEDEINRDHPELNPWALKMLLDMYCAEGGKSALDAIIKADAKSARKGKPVQPVPRETDVLGSAFIRPWEESDLPERLAAFAATQGNLIIDEAEISSSVVIEA